MVSKPEERIDGWARLPLLSRPANRYRNGRAAEAIPATGIGWPGKAWLFFGLFLLVCFMQAGSAFAQSCNPAVVNYLVRDEKGKLMNDAEITAVYERLPKSIDDARTFIGEVAFASDGKTFYWPESVDWPKGQKMLALQFINNKTCTMQLSEATLTYRHKTMRLIFNLKITRTQDDRRPVIDGPPFQEGVFKLDLKNWPTNRDQLIPARRWKHVKKRTVVRSQWSVVSLS
jgi:hypothetical protein